MEGDIKNVMKHWMEGEISNFIMVWFSVYISLCYCFFAAKMASKSVSRLLVFSPVISLFFFLPLALHSVHLGGTTAFFITWLANFKLLMLAFNHGPLSHPSISLPSFLILACLPIKIQQNYIQPREDSLKNSHSAGSDESAESAKNSPLKFKNGITATQNGNFQENPFSESSKISGNVNFEERSSVEISENRQKSALSYAVKVVLLGLIIRVYDYSDIMNSTMLLVIYCFHIYFGLEIILAIVAAMASVVLGLELEPQFNEPYLSTSLQDFWGRRWNLMVTRILRPTVYNPVLSASARYLGRKWAVFPAVMSTFIVSGLMHELIFFYLGRAKPTWEITWFFLLHGACLMVEIAVKKALKGTCRFPRIPGTILTVGFVMLTGFWLFFPQLLRCEADARSLAEYAALGAFVKDIGRALTIGARSA